MREVGCRLTIAIGSSQEPSAAHQNEIIPLREVERLALSAMTASSGLQTDHNNWIDGLDGLQVRGKVARLHRVPERDARARR